MNAVAYIYPSITDFQNYFARDFPFGSDSTTVQTADISNALNEMGIYINPLLFQNQASFTLGALRLTAHYLVMNLRASSQGIWGSYPWSTDSKSVGSVSQHSAIPERILNNPMYSMLTQTNYGAQYLYSILPLLCGQMVAVFGGTNY